jgi:TatD DNase family protein
VLETDAPYLSPHPFRGKRNEPAHIQLIAQKISEIKRIHIKEVIHQTTLNALKLYQLL